VTAAADEAMAMTLAIATSQSPALVLPGWPPAADWVPWARGEEPVAVAGTDT